MDFLFSFIRKVWRHTAYLSVTWVIITAMMALPVFAAQAPAKSSKMQAGGGLPSADNEVKVRHVLASGDCTLESGQTLHLRGIKIADAKGVALIMRLVEGKAIYLIDAATDRYGRVEADVALGGTLPPSKAAPDKNASSAFLQDRLLDQGMAFVYPVSGNEPRLLEMLRREAAARAEQRGIWADNAFGDVSAEMAESKIGSYAFIRGKVLRVERIKSYVYLNFGSDYRTDFTVAIRVADLRQFKKAKADPLEYQGKTIRVRGWVIRKGGAMINVITSLQIEILN